MVNNIEIQGYNVLTELNHNSNDNPHSQYVGTNRDTMLKPSFDLLNAQSGDNLYWKIATFTVKKSEKRNITFCFDLFDEYEGLVVGRSSYEINIFNTEESSGSSQFFPNNLNVRIYGTDYDRVFLAYRVNADNTISCEIYIKNLNNWNFPKLSVRYLNYNNYSFKLINNERMVKSLPSGVEIVSSIPKFKNIISDVSTGVSYVKLAEFNPKYTLSKQSVELSINRIKETSNSILSSCRINFQFYNDSASGTWTSAQGYFLNNVNFNSDDIFYVMTDRKIELYGKFTESGQVFSTALTNILDFSKTSNREVKVEKWANISEVTGTRVYIKNTNILNLYDSVNNVNNTFYLDSWKVKIKNAKNEIIGVVPTPFTISQLDTTDEISLKINELIEKLTISGIII